MLAAGSGARADVAGVDPILGEGSSRLWEFSQQNMTVVMEITDQWHRISSVLDPGFNLGDFFGGLAVVDGNAHQFAASRCEFDDLTGGFDRVGGVGVGHGLYDDCVFATDHDPAHIYGHGFATRDAERIVWGATHAHSVPRACTGRVAGGYDFGMIGQEIPLSLTKGLYRARGKFYLEAIMKNNFVALLISSLALASCTPPDPGTSQVRFVNGVTDSTSMNVYFGQDKKNTSAVPFRSAFPSTETYSPVTGGNVAYSLCLDDLLDCSKKDQAFTAVKDDATTVLLVGTKATADDTATVPRPLEIVSFSDKTTIPAEGKARLRIVHAATVEGANKVDVYLSDPNAALTGFPVELLYKAKTEYRDWPAGVQSIRVTAPGVTNSVLVDSGPFTLVASKIYTFVIFNTGVSTLLDK
jgi:hypothetical protein